MIGFRRMAVWVERDEKTGEVVLCMADGRDCGASVKPTRRIRLQPTNAKLLGARLIAASDPDLEDFVQGSREVVETGAQVVKQAKDAAELFRRVSSLLGG